MSKLYLETQTAAVEALVLEKRSQARGRPFLLSIAGSQGSGKSTLTFHLAEHLRRTHGLRVAAFSLDDVYLSHEARQMLAETIHPMLATRGVPGTHDLDLLHAVLDSLANASPGQRTSLPAFDKLTDNPKPKRQWKRFSGRPDVIIIEGWCMGATPQTEAALKDPVNALEASEDADGLWRRYVNARLGLGYDDLFRSFDAFVYMLAPEFSAVYDWRIQQQADLLGRPLTADEQAHIRRFVGFFERITRHMLAGGRHSDLDICLDAHHAVIRLTRRSEAKPATGARQTQARSRSPGHSGVRRTGFGPATVRG